MSSLRRGGAARLEVLCKVSVTVEFKRISQPFSFDEQAGSAANVVDVYANSG